MSNEFELKTAKCPHCGAEIKVPSTAKIAVCDYCGFAFAIENPSLEVRHYIFRAVYDGPAAFEHLKRFIIGRPLVPKDFEKEASPADQKLYYIPIYLYKVDMEAYCSKMDPHPIGWEYRYITEIAAGKIPIELPSPYPFPVSAREYFRPEFLRSGIFIAPDRDPYSTLKKLKNDGKAEIGLIASEACQWYHKYYYYIDNTEFVGLSHYPFLLITYSYKGKLYNALIDATDGNIVFAEYPISAENRLKWLMISLAGFLLVLPLSQLISNWLFGGAPPTISRYAAMTYFVVYILVVRRLLRSKERYSYSPSESGALSPPR